MRKPQSTLTTRQRDFFSYLQNRISSGGGTPSLRRAAEDLGISHTAVASLLQSLQEKGWIRREGRYSRSVALLGQEPAASLPSGRAVPIIGRVAAGLPLVRPAGMGRKHTGRRRNLSRRTPFCPAGPGRFDAQCRDSRRRPRHLRTPAVRGQRRNRGGPDQQRGGHGQTLLLSG